MENQTPNSKVQWWKSLLAKKWTFPAIYLVASVLIVTLLWTRIDTENYQLSKEDSIFNEQQSAQEPLDVTDSEVIPEEVEAVEVPVDEAIPVVVDEPQLVWPLEVTEAAEIVHQFYDQSASEEDRMQAIYEYNNTIYTSNGIDIIKGGDKFDVMAVADGQVVMAEEDALHGKKVKISHGDGFETVYASMSDISVQVGDEVEAGQVIGQAGKSEIKHDLPNHLYFEAYREGEAINPVSILPALTGDRT